MCVCWCRNNKRENMSQRDAFQTLQDKWSAAFRHLDLAKNGVITDDNVVALCEVYDEFGLDEDMRVRTHIPVNILRTAVQKRFGTWKDQRTRDEYMESLSWAYLKNPAWFRASWEMYFDAIFEVFDLDRDGVISKVEFVFFYKNRGKNVEEADALFKLLDKNGDGKISRKEYVYAYGGFMCDPDIDCKELPLFKV